MEVDVLVAGSGAAAMVASLTAARAGLRVQLAESTAFVGGTTAISGGSLWIPCNDVTDQGDRTDSVEDARAYLRAIVGNYYSDKVDAFIENAPQALRFIKRHSELKFWSPGAHDYYPSAPGAKASRSVFPHIYDGKELGSDLNLLRSTIPQTRIFGMQVDATDIPHLQNARRSARSSFHVLGMAIRTAWDLAVYGHGTRLTGGNALAAGLLTALRKSGVTIWTNARVEKLIAKNGSVIGGQINRSGKEIAVHARRGVILATGGFGANGAMRARHIPLAEHGWSLQPGGNQGDGIRMGMEAGGQFIEENIANQIGMPMSAARRPDGSVKIAIHYAVDRHSPGSIVIDNQGQRFVNEATDYQKFTDMMRARGVGTAFLIGDHRFQRKYGMGLARPAPMPVGQFVSANYLLRGDTLEELAEKMGVNGRALAKTIAEFNKHARNGVDPAFQRGNDDYSKSMGDAGHKPNPCLAPLEDAPFYALAIHPGDVSTVCGLATDAHARVLNQDGAPIPGLYAAGLDMNSVFRGAYPGGGASIGAAITFAFIAASHLQS